MKIAKKRRRGGGGEVESDSRETPICATTREDINALLADGYKVSDHILPDPKNKPIATSKPTNRYIKRDRNGMA